MYLAEGRGGGGIEQGGNFIFANYLGILGEDH